MAALALVAGAAAYLLLRKTPGPLTTASAEDFATIYDAKPDVFTNQTFDCAPRSPDHEWYRTDRTLTVDYTNPDILYVSVEWKGVFKSTDGGKTWAQKTKGIKVYARSDDMSRGCYSEYPTIEIDPNDHNHLVLATSGGGGGFIDDETPNSQTGGGYQSFDGGETWHILINNKMNLYTNGIVIDPTDSKTLYYTTSSGPASWVGADQNKKYVTKGLIYKTTDGAKTWEELPTGIGQNSSVINVMVNPDNPLELVAPTFSATRLSANGSGTGISSGKDTTIDQLGVLHSIDGGKTWSKFVELENNPPVLESWAAPTNFSHMYFVANPSSTTETPYGFVMTDGKTVQKTKYLDYVAYDPHDSTGNHAVGFSTVMIGPANQNLSLWETMDGGLTWSRHGSLPTEISDPNGGQTKISKIVWHPTDPNGLFMSGAGGLVWKSSNLGQTWTKLLDYTQLPK